MHSPPMATNHSQPIVILTFFPDPRLWRTDAAGIATGDNHGSTRLRASRGLRDPISPTRYDHVSRRSAGTLNAAGPTSDDDGPSTCSCGLRSSANNDT